MGGRPGWGNFTTEDTESTARLQRLTRGPLVENAPRGAEVWLDGGHNPHGAEAVSRAMADMEEYGERPLYLICGMLANKDALGYLRTFNGLARHVVTVGIPGMQVWEVIGPYYQRVTVAPAQGG